VKRNAPVSPASDASWSITTIVTIGIGGSVMDTVALTEAPRS